MPTDATTRAARSVPFMRLADLAAVARTGDHDPGLRQRTPRGRCDATAEALLTRRGALAVFSTDTRAVAMAHPACPPPSRRLAGLDTHTKVRAAAHGAAGWVARSAYGARATRHQVARLVSGDMSPQARSRSADSRAITAWLALTRGQATRQLSAVSRQCPLWILAGLAADTAIPAYSKVGAAVAANHATPPQVLALLASRLALATGDTALSGSSAGLRDSRHDTTVGLAANRRCPPAVLEVLAAQPDELLRRLVAGNRACPHPAAETLATDEDWRVRETVARRAELPAHLLEALLRDPDVSVRKAAADNPNCPPRLPQALSRCAAADSTVSLRLSTAGGACRMAAGGSLSLQARRCKIWRSSRTCGAGVPGCATRCPAMTDRQ